MDSSKTKILQKQEFPYSNVQIVNFYFNDCLIFGNSIIQKTSDWKSVPKMLHKSSKTCSNTRKTISKYSSTAYFILLHGYVRQFMQTGTEARIILQSRGIESLTCNFCMRLESVRYGKMCLRRTTELMRRPSSLALTFLCTLRTCRTRIQQQKALILVKEDFGMDVETSVRDIRTALHETVML